MPDSGDRGIEHERYGIKGEIIMTAQVGDRFIYGGDDYSIVAISSPIQFAPSDYGIKPVPRCTACWNGYWCEYQIFEEAIMLKNLYMAAILK